MHIGVKIGLGDGPEIAGIARRAEELGFDSVWLSERVATPLDKPHPYPPSGDPWIGLAFVAAATRRVRLGTSVSQIALRPPVLMARELATLDRLSGGRLIVGAGAGWVEEEFTSTGVDFATRGGRLSEYIQLLRHLWTNPEQPWEGKHFQVPPVGLTPPLTPGGPPILAGAASRPGLRRVAKYTDGLIALAMPPERLAGIRSRLAELWARYGRPGAPEVFIQTEPPGSPDAARDLVRSYAEAGATGLILASASTVSLSGAEVMDDPETVAALLEAAAG